MNSFEPAYRPKKIIPAGKNNFFQPKLAINNPNDQYEKEADNIAEKVVTMETPLIQTKPMAITAIQRKCADCEEEEKKMQRKETTGDEPVADNHLENYIGNLDSSGRSLPPEVRNYYEPRFGYNFSNVKVHTDAVAAKSAQSVNALAYTNGNNIVFNQSQYAPQTGNGKKLLAHELTHVVQQGHGAPANIQRLSPNDPSFKVSGLPADSEEKPEFVFFDRDESTVPSTETHKIDDFATANGSQPVINLYGYSSEEGSNSANDTLIGQRLSNVQSAMLASLNAPGATFSGKVNTIARRDASSQQVDYRSYRAVEMSTGASTIPAPGASVSTRNCTTGENTDVDKAQSTSLTSIGEAKKQVQGFIDNPAASDNVKTALDNNFHSHSVATATTLRNHLKQVETDLTGLTGNSKRRCVPDQYNDCYGADALTDKPKVIFCPNFFSDDTDPQREQTLTHEMSHYAFGANDRAYRNERVLRILSTAEALDNAESIAIFVTEINDPSGTRVDSALTNPPADTVTGCGSNQPMADEALAWAQRWNSYAYFGLSQTYSDWDSFVKMSPFITRWLGPVNLHSLAGIYDRYSKLNDLFEGTFKIECSAALPCVTPIQLDPVADVLTICPTFFALSLHNRIVFLYAEITKKVPEIRDDQRKAYPELARDYKIHYWDIPST